MWNSKPTANTNEGTLNEKSTISYQKTPKHLHHKQTDSDAFNSMIYIFTDVHKPTLKGSAIREK